MARRLASFALCLLLLGVRFASAAGLDGVSDSGAHIKTAFALFPPAYRPVLVPVLFPQSVVAPNIIVQLDASGNLMVTSSSGGGPNTANTFSNTVLTLDGSGNLKVNCASGCIPATNANLQIASLGLGVAASATTGTIKSTAPLIIFPSTDTTSAVQFTKADGTTAVLTLDTTNKLQISPYSGTGPSLVGSNSSYGVNFGNGTGGNSFNVFENGTPALSMYTTQLYVGSNVGYVWSNTTNTITGSADAGLARNAAGIVEVNNGTAGTFRDLALRKVTTFNSIATQGLGVGGIFGSYSTTGNTAAVTNAINYTPPATAGGYGVRGLVDVTAWTTPASFTVQCVYTDASGTSRTETLGLTRGTTGATATAVTAVDRWYFSLPMFTINNAAAAITCSTTGTFTGSPVYNLAFILHQYQ